MSKQTRVTIAYVARCLCGCTTLYIVPLSDTHIMQIAVSLDEIETTVCTWERTR